MNRDAESMKFKQRAVQRAEEAAELREALEESVKLQCHYAKLLNQYDGGSRMTFENVDAWMARLREIKR